MKFGKKTPDLSSEYVRRILNYYPETGSIKRVFKNKRYGQRETGFFDRNGYLLLSIDSSKYLAHRVIWLWMTGSWPDVWVDHIDGNKANNRWSNLRPATRDQNMRNARSVRRRHQLPRGVGYSSKAKQSFRARLKIHGHQLELGSYPTAEEASEVYQLVAELAHGSYAYHLSQGASEKKAQPAQTPG